MYCLCLCTSICLLELHSLQISNPCKTPKYPYHCEHPVSLWFDWKYVFVSLCFHFSRVTWILNVMWKLLQETLVENKLENVNSATAFNVYQQQRSQLKQHQPRIKIPLVFDETILRDTEYMRDNSVDVWVGWLKKKLDSDILNKN